MDDCYRCNGQGLDELTASVSTAVREENALRLAALVAANPERILINSERRSIQLTSQCAPWVHDEADVRRIGRGLLASWSARGWVGLAVDHPSLQPPEAASDIGAVLTLIDRAQTLGAKFPGSDTRFRLTEQARADVEWLGPAT